MQVLQKKIHLYSITISNFEKHITSKHKEHFEYEKDRLKVWRGSYFKCVNHLDSRRIICGATIKSEKAFAKNHLKLHSREQLNNCSQEII